MFESWNRPQVQCPSLYRQRCRRPRGLPEERNFTPRTRTLGLSSQLGTFTSTPNSLGTKKGESMLISSRKILWNISISIHSPRNYISQLDKHILGIKQPWQRSQQRTYLEVLLLFSFTLTTRESVYLFSYSPFLSSAWLGNNEFEKADGERAEGTGQCRELGCGSCCVPLPRWAQPWPDRSIRTQEELEFLLPVFLIRIKSYYTIRVLIIKQGEVHFYSLWEKKYHFLFWANMSISKNTSATPFRRVLSL